MALLTEEQRMLRDAARGWVQSESPVTALRKLRDQGSEAGFDPAAWRAMADMGWAGVIVPEAFGGAELGCRSMGLLLEETGRTLTASPLLASALVGASALVLGGSEEQRAEWLPRIASADIIAALAVDEGPHHAPEAISLAAEPFGEGWRLTGRKAFVLEGASAGLFIVAARTGGHPGEAHGVSLFLVPAGAEGVSREPLELMDGRGAVHLHLDQVYVGDDAVIGPLHDGWDLLEHVLDRGRAGFSAEMLGSASQAFEITLDYLKTRTQFGQPIGAFQALQHRAAKMYVELELSRSAVEAALDALDADGADAPLLVSLAKAKVGETLHLVTNEMVQMHGGIGMTDAHDAGFFIKRARVAEAAFGSAAYHRDRYARLQGY